MSSMAIHFELIVFLELESVQRIVGNLRTWMIHLMHPSKQAEDCLQRILQTEMSFDRVDDVAAKIGSLTRMRPSVWEAPIVYRP